MCKELVFKFRTPHGEEARALNATSVTFYSGNLSLLRRENGLQYFSTTLQPSQASTIAFKVTGTLTGGALTSTYSIPFDFYDENSTKFDSAMESLTVNSS